MFVGLPASPSISECNGDVLLLPFFNPPYSALYWAIQSFLFIERTGSICRHVFSVQLGLTFSNSVYRANSKALLAFQIWSSCIHQRSQWCLLECTIRRLQDGFCTYATSFLAAHVEILLVLSSCINKNVTFDSFSERNWSSFNLDYCGVVDFFSLLSVCRASGMHNICE